MKEKEPGNGTGAGEELYRLVEQYSSYLMAVILPIVGDAGEAQDVLQEAFWQAYCALPRYRGGNVKFWLARIAANKAIDWRRKRERRRETILPLLLETAGGAAVLSAEEEYFRSLSRERLEGLFKNLPPPYRTALAGYLLEGKSYRQMAEEEGVTVKTVESRLYRAKRILRKQWKEGY